jgi:predicted amidohydrolase YtcJ
MSTFRGRFFDGTAFQRGIVHVRGNLIHTVKMDVDSAPDKADIVLGEDEVLVPGFIDAHGHLGTALANSMLNMTPLNPPPISTVDTLDALVSTLVKAYSGSGPVVGVDYDDSFTGDHPTYTVMLTDGKRNALQAIEDETKQRDIIIIHNSGHMAVVSRNILDCYYKILRPDGRVIENWSETESDLAESFPLDLVMKDSQGFPTGLLLEGAWMAIVPFFAGLMEGVSGSMFEKFGLIQEQMLRMGVTGVQDAACNLTNSALFAAIDQAGLLQLSLYKVWDVQHVGPEEEKIIQDKLTSRPTGIPLVHESGAKLFLDGSPQGQTAGVTAPYANDENNYGTMTFEGKEAESKLREKIATYVYGVRTSLNVHCNGDKAIDQLLRLCADLLSSNDGAPFPAPVVIVHCQLMSEANRDDLLELRRNGADVRPSFFPNHTYYFAAYEEKILGSKRIANMSPCQWAVEHHIPFTIHADGPVTPLWPKYMVSTAYNRTDRKGAVHGPSQAISVADALRALTQYAADQVGMDRLGGYGRIREGYSADLVVLGKMPNAYVPPPLHMLTPQTFGTDQDGHFTVNRVFKNGVEVGSGTVSERKDSSDPLHIKLNYHRCPCC